MEKDKVDSGYAWVIVAAVFAVHFFVLGTIYTFGFFYSEYLNAFQGSSGGEIAWIGSICAGSTLAIAGFTGAMADRFGNGKCVCVGGAIVLFALLLASFATEVWQLYITQGLMCGFGYSLAFVGAISVMDQWFNRRRGLAVGIAVSGSGFGQVALAPLTNLLLRSQGWRRTLRWIAAVTAIGVITSGYFIERRIPLVNHSRNRSESNIQIFCSKLQRRFQDRNFAVMYLAMFLTSMGYMMPFTHIVKYSEIVGVSPSRGVLIVSLVGMSSAMGRASLGQVADKCSRLDTFRVCLLMGGLSTLSWIACKDFISLATYGALFGFFAGGFVSLQPVVCSELFQGHEMGELMGLVYTASTAGNLFSAPLGGILFDATGNYTVSIVVAGMFMVCGAGLSLWLRIPVVAMSAQEGKDFALVAIVANTPAYVYTNTYLPEVGEEDVTSSTGGCVDESGHDGRLLEDNVMRSSVSY